MLGGGLGVLLQGLVNLSVGHIGGGHSHLNPHVLGQLEVGHHSQSGLQRVGTVLGHHTLGSTEIQHLQVGVILQALLLNIALHAVIEFLADFGSKALGNHALGSLTGAETGQTGALGIVGQNAILHGGHITCRYGSAQAHLAIADFVDSNFHGTRGLKIFRWRILADKRHTCKHIVRHIRIFIDFLPASKIGGKPCPEIPKPRFAEK